MTCIVGLEHEGAVTLGADTASSNHHRVDTYRMDKLFRAGPYLIGGSGAWRPLQRIRYALTPPTPPPTGDLMGHMTTKFVDSLRDCLKAGGTASKESEVEEFEASFLVACRDQLFVVYGSYQVMRPDTYDAIGSGGAVARGAMHALRDRKMSPRARLRAALEAAAAHDPYVRGPFTLLGTDDEPDEDGAA